MGEVGPKHRDLGEPWATFPPGQAPHPQLSLWLPEAQMRLFNPPFCFR